MTFGFWRAVSARALMQVRKKPNGFYLSLTFRQFKLMKKKLLLAGAALLLAAAAVTGFSAYEESNISDLLNANVEALADNETVHSAYSQAFLCTLCEATVHHCVHCIEPDCGSCTTEEHGCRM